MKNLFLIVCFVYSVTSVSGQWVQTKYTSPLQITSLLPYQDTLYATMGGNIRRSTDGFETFESIRGNGSGFYYTLYADDKALFAGGLDGGLFKSSTYGFNWVKLENGILSSSTFWSLDSRDSLIIATTTSRIYKSTDHGNSWKRAIENDFFPGTGYKFKTLLLDSVFIVAGANGIYRSTDLGETWNVVEIGNLDFMNIISVGNTIYIADSGSGIYKSTDFGLTWENIAGNIPIKNFDALIALEDSTLVAANYDNIYALKPGQTEWIPLMHDPKPFQPNSLAEFKGELYVGTIQNGIWKRGLDNLTSMPFTPENTEPISVFPNPATNYIAFPEVTNNSIPATVSIYDAMGRLLKKETIDGATVSIGELRAGFYHCILRRGDNFFQTQFVKH